MLSLIKKHELSNLQELVTELTLERLDAPIFIRMIFEELAKNLVVSEHAHDRRIHLF